MRQQINFFANALDESKLHARILEEFDELHAFEAVGGGWVKLPLCDARDSLSSTSNLMILPEIGDSPELPPPGPNGLVRLGTSAQGVIEYRRCITDENSGILKAGRLFFQRNDGFSLEQIHRLNKLFNWIRRNTLPTPADRRFRVFKNAATSGLKLDYGFGFQAESPGWI